MKKTAFLITIILTAAFVAVTSAAAAEEPRTISVTGEGRAETAPDMATIRLGVTNEAKEARAAMAATSQAVGQILDRLTAMGVAERDVQTQRLTLNPVWSQYRTDTGEPENRITGFAASNIVMVRVRDLPSLGGVLDAVIADGANEFNGLQFSVQDPDPLVEQARRDAVADAMAKAETLAQAAGITLGPVQSIAEHGGRPQPMMMEMAAARSSADMPVASGEVALEASVSMVFAIAD